MTNKILNLSLLGIRSIYADAKCVMLEFFAETCMEKLPGLFKPVKDMFRKSVYNFLSNLDWVPLKQKLV